MAQIKGKMIGANQVNDTIVRFLNAGWLRALNFAGTADINALRINASDRIEFASVPQVTADPATANDLVRKSYADGLLTNYIPTSQKGVASGVATLDSNGLIPTSQLPPLAINEVFTVADQAAMLALVAERGDMAIRQDNGLTYVLAADAPGTLANWKQITAAGTVVSVNGQTGVVLLTTDNVGEGTAQYFTAARAKTAVVVDSLAGTQTDQAPSVSSVKTALAAKADSFAFGKERKTLAAQDITNQYIDLAHPIKANSLRLVCFGVEQVETVDYTVSLAGGSGGVTRVSFAPGGDIATGGAAALVAADVVDVAYAY